MSDYIQLKEIPLGLRWWSHQEPGQSAYRMAMKVHILLQWIACKPKEERL